MRRGLVRRVDDECGVQVEPGDGRRDDHVEGEGAHAVLRIGSTLDEESGNGACGKKDKAAVRGAVGNAVVGVCEIPQVVSDDPEPQLIGSDVVFLFTAADDDAEESADADGV